MPIAKGTQVPPAFSSLLMNSVCLGETQPQTVLAVKVFFRHGVPEPEHILLNQSLGFSCLPYTIWQHKIHQTSWDFSELQFAGWLSMRMDRQLSLLLLCYLYLQFPRASFWEVQVGESHSQKKVCLRPFSLISCWLLRHRGLVSNSYNIFEQDNVAMLTVANIVEQKDQISRVKHLISRN